MEQTVGAFQFKKPTDPHKIRTGIVIETDKGLEKVVFNNYLTLRTLSRQSGDDIVYCQYDIRGENFNPNTRKVFGGPFNRYSADSIESEIFDLLDRELRLGGL